MSTSINNRPIFHCKVYTDSGVRGKSQCPPGKSVWRTYLLGNPVLLHRIYHQPHDQMSPCKITHCVISMPSEFLDLMFTISTNLASLWVILQGTSGHRVNGIFCAAGQDFLGDSYVLQTYFPGGH